MDKSNVAAKRLKRNRTDVVLGLAVKLLAVLAGLYVILNLSVYVFQEKLLFFPIEISDAECAQLLAAHSNVKDISLPMQDGTRLRGWLVESQAADASGLLIYFGGNGDELSLMIDSLQRYPDWSVVLINYRGYGQSEGEPREEYLFSDALEIYDYFTAGSGDEYAKKVVMGRSMGTGVAVYVAQNRPVDGVILASPYDSILRVAQEKLPLVPVKYLLRNRFDSIGRAADISAPVLVCIADRDELILPRHSLALAQEFAGPVQIREIAGADHNSILQKEDYWQSIDQFLKEL